MIPWWNETKIYVLLGEPSSFDEEFLKTFDVIVVSCCSLAEKVVAEASPSSLPFLYPQQDFILDMFLLLQFL